MSKNVSYWQIADCQLTDSEDTGERFVLGAPSLRRAGMPDE